MALMFAMLALTRMAEARHAGVRRVTPWDAELDLLRAACRTRPSALVCVLALG